MKKITFTLLLAASAIMVKAQAPAISWQKSFGGTLADIGISGLQTTDGGYIVGGYTGSNNGDISFTHGGTDAWVTKLSSTGSLSWQKCYGGPGSEAVRAIRQTSDGGYIFAGYNTLNGGDVLSNHGSNDFWVVKITSAGAISWQKSFGGTNAENAYSIRETYEGGYIVAGFSASSDGDVSGAHGGTDAWVVKLTSTGSISWQKALGGTGDDYAYDVIQTTDSGYAITGISGADNGDVTSNHGSDDVWVIKLDKTGALSWQKSLGGSDYDWANAIIQTSDGGYAIAASTASSNWDVTGSKGGEDTWIIKLSATGSLEWQKTYGGSADEETRSIVETAGGGFIVAASTSSNDSDVTANNGGGDCWILKLSATGAIQWQKSYGGSGNEEAYEIGKTTDGGYFFAGNSTSNDVDASGNHGSNDFWVVKLAACTPASPVITVSGATLSTTATYTTYQWKLAGVAIPGATAATYTATANGDYSVDITDGYGCAATSPAQTISTIGVGVHDINSGNGIMVFPNPSNGSFTIKLPASSHAMSVIITDITGKVAATRIIENNQANEASFNLNNMASGSYLLKVVAGDTTYRDNIMVIK